LSSQHIESRERAYAVGATCVVFLILLAGNYDFGRVGLGTFAGLPIKLWLVLLASVILLPWWRSLPSRARAPESGRRATTAYGVWVLAMIFSSAWAPPGALVTPRVIDFGVSLACAVLMLTAFRAAQAVALRTLMSTLAVTGSVYALAGLLTLGSVGRVSAFGGGPNVYGRVTGLAVLAVCHLVLSKTWPALTAVLLPPLVFATAASGSRGAVLALAVGLVTLAPSVFRERRRFVAAQLWLVPAAGLIWIVIGQYVTNIVAFRFGVLTLQDRYSSGRQNLYPVAIDMIKSSPLRGQGLGSFGVVVNDPSSYPHNLLLQTAAESGLFGLVPLLLALGFGLVPMLRRWGRSLRCTTLLAMSLLMLSASMVSGDYYDSRLAWVFITVGSLLCSRPEVEAPPLAAVVVTSSPLRRPTDRQLPSRTGPRL